MAHIDPDGEAPFTLYGAGIAVGVADLYVPRVSTNTYHLHALVPGRICSRPQRRSSAVWRRCPATASSRSSRHRPTTRLPARLYSQ